MLKSECFKKEWIDQVRTDNPPADPTIVEKTIYAFELLANLINQKLDFIFKGGTSIIMLVDKPQRLSIDIDISTDVKANEVESVLTKIVEKSIFTSWNKNERIAKKIPKKHYRLYFNSVINPKQDSYILLDVLFQKNPYPKTIKNSISNRFIKLEEDIKCVIPTINSLVGDKLTAFAPNTTGIPYGIGKAMQIQKQLFDLGSLFPLVNDINEVKQAFENFVKVEAGYREDSFSTDEVCNDIISTSFLQSQMLLKKAMINEHTKELQEGISKLQTHLIGIKYNLEIAKLFAAKTAFLVASFDNQKEFTEKSIYRIDKISDKKLKTEYRILERIKTILPEAYYYWQLINTFKRES
ncbi:MAG: nucleotidyl transferase AbiEii/AbiGii toxin family protein [Melioribacteraceae bacterium]|nr:nucleotidyl transferase AbiEii/AbiGii toxin family protein [Melioribacteraceae bacterium]